MKKRLYILVVYLVALFLVACNSGDNEGSSSADKEQAQQAQATDRASATSGAPAVAGGTPQGRAPYEEQVQGPPPSQEELEKADALVAFYNVAAATLAEPYYVQAETMMEHVQHYLREWALAPRPAPGGDGKVLARRLAAPAAMFGEDEVAALSQWVDDMEKSIQSMRADYAALGRYVRDEDIRDDGVKGRALAASLEKGHARFMAARNGYLALVEGRAVKAEEALLYGHPLRRQILEARNIFGLYAGTAELLAAQTPDRQALEQVRAKLVAGLRRAGQPPFAAAPEVERAYRDFLKQAARYEALLGQGLDQGFYSPLRQELNQSAQESRQAYNIFVRTANSN